MAAKIVNFNTDARDKMLRGVGQEPDGRRAAELVDEQRHHEQRQDQH